MTSILQYFKTRIKFTASILFLLYSLTLDVLGVTAKFTYLVKYTCAPSVVIFSNESSTDPGTQFEWDFGKGAVIFSNEKTLQELYATPGTYTVMLVAKNGTDTDTTTQEITIAKGPTAQITLSNASGCIPLRTTFINNSLPGSYDIISASWDFRNGESATGNSVNYTYRTAGSYGVFMKVVDNNGCYDVAELKNSIIAYSLPKLNFFANDSFACNAPLYVSFRNASRGNNQFVYNWKYGNSQQSSGFSGSTTYTQNGNYSVTLTARDAAGCADSITKNNYIRIGAGIFDIEVIKPLNVPGPDTFLCQGSYKFSTSANQAGCSWTFDYNNSKTSYNGTNSINFNVPDSGILKITLKYGLNSKCPGEISKTFYVDYVKAGFEFNKTSSCKFGEELKVSSNSINANKYKYLLPSGAKTTNKSFIYSLSGGESYQNIYNHEANKIPFLFQQFVTSKNGCSDSISKSYFINLPVARFMPDTTSGCVPLLVTLSDSSRAESVIKSKYYIIEKNNIALTGKERVKYAFSKPGTYQVKQVIETAEGCIDTSYAVSFKVGEKLKPAFTISKNEACYGDTISISGTSNLNDSIHTWQYSCPNIFNSGVLYNSDYKAVINADSAGFHEVHLQIDYNGCFSDTIIKNSINVKGPLGMFRDSFSCDKPYDYTFVSQIKPSTSLSWKIDTIEYATTDTFRYTFMQPGNYRIKLLASDAVSGCKLERSKVIPVRKIKASFEVDSFVCLGNPVTFKAKKSVDYINSCFNEGFLWDFNDVPPKRRTYMDSIIYTFQNEGIHTPILKVFADNGCSDSINGKINVVNVKSSFSVDTSSGCAPNLNVTFTKDSIDPTIIKLRWILGNQSEVVEDKQSFQHTYSSTTTKEYYPALYALDYHGCYTISSEKVSIHAVSANFMAYDNSLCLGKEASFFSFENNLDSYLWNFGDGAISSTNNTHNYLLPDKYSVSLKISKNGCTDSLTIPEYISVEKADASYNLSSSTLSCYPDSVAFTHLSPLNVAEGIWTFDTLRTSNFYSSNPNYTYSWPGAYKTSLWIRTLNNCEASATQIITVDGPFATLNFQPNQICSGGEVSFNITNKRNTSEYEIFFGDGESSTQSPVSHSYKAKGIIYPQIMLKNNACKVTLGADSLFVSRISANFDFFNNRNVICTSTPVYTRNRSTYYNLSEWILDGTKISNTTELGDVYLQQLGNHNVKLIVSDANGCKDSITKIAVSVPKADFSIAADTVICSGNATQVTFTLPPKGKVIWNPSKYLVHNQIIDPLIMPDSSIMYSITMTDSNKCTTTKPLNIEVVDPIQVIRQPIGDTSILIGSKIQLNVGVKPENATLIWSPDNQISCTSCPNPIVSPKSDITYSLNLKNGCSNLVEKFFINVIKDFYIVAPDAFSPNNDGENEEFRFETRNIGQFELKIFNRWGNLVYSTNDYHNGWNGTVNGKKQNADTYSYIIEAETTTGYKVEKKGTFILIR